MSGFKNFLLRGNLVEIAVGFIMATAFGAVVTALVALILAVIGKAGGQPNFDKWQPGHLPVGVFITALVSFLILGVAVYFLVVVPYTKAKERFFPSEPEGMPADIALLQEIRDLLRAQQSTGSTGGTPTV
jgi:large conductance mechanosensitive channel